MNAILGFSELLRTQMAASKDRNYLDAITSSGRTLLTLINDILDLSKIEAGKLELQFEPVSVARLIDEIQKLFSIKAGEKGIKLLTEIDPQLPRGLMLDEVRLRQVLFNVVGNALKFTEKGHVKIKATFDRSSRREEALTSKSEIRNPKSEIEVSLLTSAATKMHGGAACWMNWRRAGPRCWTRRARNWKHRPAGWRKKSESWAELNLGFAEEAFHSSGAAGGGTGYQPVPVGNLPTGRRRTLCENGNIICQRCLTVPPGW